MLSIKGNVSTPSKVIKDVDVTLKKVPGGEIVDNTTTNESGNYNLTGNDPGVHEVEINSILLDAGVNILRGRISVDSDPGIGLEVRCFDSGNNMLGSTFTDNRGGFNFDYLPDGEIKTVVTLSNFQPPQQFA